MQLWVTGEDSGVPIAHGNNITSSVGLKFAVCPRTSPQRDRRGKECTGPNTLREPWPSCMAVVARLEAAVVIKADTQALALPKQQQEVVWFSRCCTQRTTTQCDQQVDHINNGMTLRADKDK